MSFLRTRPPAAGLRGLARRSLRRRPSLRLYLDRPLLLAEPVKSDDLATAGWFVRVGNRQWIGGWGRDGGGGPRALMIVRGRWPRRLAIGWLFSRGGFLLYII